MISTPRNLVNACFVLLIMLAPGQAAASPASVRSALEFAEEKNWQNATQHAQNSGNPALVKLIEWQRLLDPDSGATFDEITHFIENSPTWPEQKKLQLRAEQSLRDTNVGKERLAGWFAIYPPISGLGKWLYAETLPESKKEDITRLLREAWVDGDYGESREQQFLERYGAKLRTQDHEARADRLLWDEKITAARRMLPLVNNHHQVLYSARMALISDNKQAPKLVEQVPASLRGDAGLLFDRLQWRARRKDTNGVRELLKEAPAHIPNPQRWWRMRELQVRKAVDEGKHSLALKLLQNHGQTEGSEYADATWLKGWVLLQFKGEFQQAYRQFYDLFGKVKSPVSKARAAYWAGRAALKANDKPAAENWFKQAAAFPTTFYGQLSLARLSGQAPLELPAMPAVSEAARTTFNNQLLVQATRLAIEENDNSIANTLFLQLIENANGREELALIAQMGHEEQKPQFSVRSAKRIMQQKGEVIYAHAYPLVKLPDDLGVEEALILAIARQESEFDPRAVSPSGAVGLAQLLPSTAAEVARKLDVPYTESRLYEAGYNLHLGSQYLGRMVRGFDGSYIAAMAAYNAGPGRVREWVGEIGMPPKSEEGAVDWIEKIPFAETRNYVMRVSENLQVYRHLLARQSRQAEGLRIVEDVTR